MEKSKIFMHENFCVTNMTLCKICKEPIMNNEFEEHTQEHEEENKILEEKKKEEINQQLNKNVESK